ncbi:ketopantoate reductase [Mangrovibacterium diazotrophicum]|uniref:2-dehydropantoate 2-reductase n=2 Tax=Mangrovibacterium diazotrophicum TaxID=1261403 RepID=A0A419W419_9BACT|nr:ketopantoate reductase [Mangrovibacterium diazotrophicum]
MNKPIQKVSIIGLGALGILYGEHFLRKMPADDLRIIADSDRVDRYKSEGIFCNGKACDFNYVTPEEKVEPADLIIFAVKYTTLPEAIRMVKGHVGPDTIILSVLNGVVSEEEIGAVYGKEHLLYSVAQGMTAAKVGNQMSYKSKGILCFGELNATENSVKVERVKSFFDQVDLPYEINNRMHDKLWSKLMINVGVNQTVGYFNATNKLIQQPGKPREMMLAAMEEVIEVGQREGVGISGDDIAYWLKIIDSLSPDESPSMAQDVKAGRPTEVDLFAGTIVALGKKHGLAVPVNEMFLEHFTKPASGN